MVESPLISCIVPVLNGELYIRESLDSILAQTYKAIEIIVLDDGSTDGTVSIVREYGGQVKYFWQPNGGLASARNRGIDVAQGEFISFLDADDLWHPEKLERQVKRFNTRTELEFSVTHVRNFWSPELTDEMERHNDERLFLSWPGYTCNTLLARKDIFESVGEFNASIMVGEDIDWFFRAAELGVTGELMPEVLAYRRLHRSNMTRLKASESREVLLKIVKSSIERRRSLGKEKSE
jgi:glycosyltransferase involved in cell wall biosynthesis